MPRRMSPAAALAFLLGAGLLAAAVVLGAPQARAGGLPSQVIRPTTSDTTAPTSSTIPVTVTLTNPAPTTTVPAPATTVRPTATTRPAVVKPVVTAPLTPFTALPTPTTTIPATTTTIAGIGGKLPAAPVTLPLRTSGTNGHVNPVVARLAGIWFAIVVAVMLGRFFITRRGGRDRAPLA